MGSGFEVVRDGVTVTLEPEADGVGIVLAKGGQTVRAFEGGEILSDPSALASVVDGVYADLDARKS